MASFLSGLVNKATDGINNEISNVTGGAAPDASQYQNQSSSGEDPSSSDPRELMKGAHEAQQSLHDFNKARHEAEGGHGQKTSNKAKIGRFFKSALGFGEAAHKAEEAGQDLTGKSLSSFGGQGN
jgi:hypothetical protein